MRSKRTPESSKSKVGVILSTVEKCCTQLRLVVYLPMFFISQVMQHYFINRMSGSSMRPHLFCFFFVGHQNAGLVILGCSPQ